MTGNQEAASYLERLQLPEDYVLLYAIAVGYPDESPCCQTERCGEG